jgi:hypothetical protein
MSALVALALQVGLPFVTAALQNRLGNEDGRLAGEVLARIATRTGIAPEAMEEEAARAPGKIIDAMREIEKASPELVQLYLSEVQASAALALAEREGPTWMSAWRPAGMYMLGFLWLWNTVLLHVANAIWKIALPPVPFDNLIQLSGLYMGLYMGGHTVKDLAAKFGGR